jgi:hypothetical protein
MRLRCLLASALASSLALLAARAHAESSAAAPPEAAPRRTWYGWQILVADGTGLAVLFTGAGVYGAAGGNGNPGTGTTTGLVLLITGGVGVRLTAPVVHWAHGHVGVGFASLALRILLPLAGGFAAGGGDFRNSSGFLAGNLVGLAACIALDTAAFAYDEAPAPQGAVSARLPLVPQVAVTPQGFSAGFSRAF